MSDSLFPAGDGIFKNHRGLYISLVLIGLIFFAGLYDSISKSWTSDDAFISFRYAQNLVEGKGLVYNAGERVEGYSNFLWTLLVALGMELKLDPIDTTNALGVISFTSTIFIFIFISWRLFKDNRLWGIFLPLTALCLLAQAHFREFATGGLETSFFTFLISLGFAGLIFSRSRRGYLLTGLVFVLVALTRPDGIIFYPLSLFFLILTASHTPRRIWYFLLPLIVIFIPYYILRFLYYGYPFPNTYYAKSAYLSWWSQGWVYLLLYLESYYVLLLLPILGVAALIKNRRSFGKLIHLPFHFNRVQNSVLLSLLFSVIFTVYVVRVGGDFMFARFLIPVTPFLYFLMEVFAQRILNKRYLIPFVAMACLATFFYRYPDNIRSVTNKIVDERYFYPKSRIEEARWKGEVLKKYLENTDARVVIFGTQAMLAYYAEFPTVIEGTNGLTDVRIAHLPIGERIRPGHEKNPPADYFYQRGVNFAFYSGGYNSPPPEAGLTDIYFGPVRGGIYVYNRDLMRKLKMYPEVKFVDFEQFLDEYIEQMHSASRADLQTDYEFFKKYYFDHNPDSLRQNAFVAALGQN
jgi:hypothetical protein